MLHEQIEQLVSHGVSITSIVKSTGIPRSTFDYWYHGKDRQLKPVYDELLNKWLIDFKQFIINI